MRSDDKPVVVCLAGPTAAGKTDLAVHLVQHFPFEIISVDSAMVYRHMDIGTGKPGPEVLAVAPHRLIDICDPWERYSAGQFCASIRKVASESGRPVGPLLPPKTNALNVSQSTIPPRSPNAATLPKSSRTKGPPSPGQYATTTATIRLAQAPLATVADEKPRPGNEIFEFKLFTCR